MERRQESMQTLRHKCAACFRQFNRFEHLVEHMKTSYHSEHEPKCGICGKHVRTVDALREHLIGPLPKVECAKVFSKRGCCLCFKVFATPQELASHQASCGMTPQQPGPSRRIHAEKDRIYQHLGIEPASNSAVSLACVMGGGQELDICVVDEDEKLLFRNLAKPNVPLQVYNYSGMRGGGMMSNPMPLKQAKEALEGIIGNGEESWRSSARGRILVGYDLDQLLPRLGLDVPSHRRRDIARYPPLIKTNKASNTLKDLAQSLLGYEIERNGWPDAFEESVAAMRIYRRMSSQIHSSSNSSRGYESGHANGSAAVDISRRSNRELERMTPEDLLAISRSDYYCWCMDSS